MNDEFTLKSLKPAKQANLGKVFEKALQKAFEAVKLARVSFDYERILDAHSSRGAISAPRTGDFLIFNRGVCTVLEAKEVSHDYRLPAANVKADQRARMRRRSLAGIQVLVAVSHSTNGVCRLLPSAYFDAATAGSWDLSKEKELTFKQLVEELTK